MTDQNKPMVELLPCPFCGGKAEMRRNGIGDSYVLCRGCGATCSDYRVEEDAHAAKLWNRRAALAEKQTAQHSSYDLQARLKEIGGCSNHVCYIVKPVGQGTNGPCRCLDNRYKAMQVVAAYKAALAAQREG